MARLRFRVVNIHLDEEEEVASIWAVVRDDTLTAVEKLIGAVERVGEPRRGGTENCIHLARDQVVELFDKAGKTTKDHLYHEHTQEIDDSLSFVVYQMMNYG